MYVLTYKSGVYGITTDLDVAEGWAEAGLNVTEIEPDDFTNVNMAMDAVEDYAPVE